MTDEPEGLERGAVLVWVQHPCVVAFIRSNRGWFFGPVAAHG